MSEQVTIIVHRIAEDGYPDMNGLTGRVAFIWDGYVVTGWPLRADFTDETSPYTGDWEAADDKLSSVRAFRGVEYWVEFPESIWKYEQRQATKPDTPESGA